MYLSVMLEGFAKFDLMNKILTKNEKQYGV